MFEEMKAIADALGIIFEQRFIINKENIIYITNRE